MPPRLPWLADAVTPLTRSQLGTPELEFLGGLPHCAVFDIDGLRVACFHAKPSDPLYGYLPPEREAWMHEVGTLDADLVLVGPTHLPLDLMLGTRRLINPGSVGQPKDGDPRAAFAMLVDGQPSLRRAAYPIEQTVAALTESDIDQRAVAVLSDMLRAGSAPPSPPPFTRPFANFP